MKTARSISFSKTSYIDRKQEGFMVNDNSLKHVYKVLGFCVMHSLLTRLYASFDSAVVYFQQFLTEN